MNKILAWHRSPGSEAPDRSMSVLFVCWGNVCRSPVARSIFHRYCQRQAMPFPCRIESAGVCVDEFPPAASFHMRWAARLRGYSLRSQHQMVYRNDLEEFQLVIAMDRRVLMAMEDLHPCPTAEVSLLADYLPESQQRDVPDPMNRSRRTCNLVIDLLEASCERIGQRLQQLSRCSVPGALESELRCVHQDTL